MTYIIAEIGQNHNGRVETAHALIEACAVPIRDEFGGQRLRGVDAVKFTKRDLDYECTQSYMCRPYDSPHSYGPTYGEHRQALELKYHELEACYWHAKSCGFDFVLTICAPTVVPYVLRRFEPDAIKVASRDLTNGPLLQVLAATGLPLILSTGMAGHDDVRLALDTVAAAGGTVHSVLHCLSQYPADYLNLNLRAIETLKMFRHPVGFSDHSIGIAVAPAAVALGARVIEKHVTLSRADKGSDHAGSLEPDGLRRMVRDIRNVEKSLGNGGIVREPCVRDTAAKLERSIAAARPIRAGERIDSTNTMMLSPGTGFRWPDRNEVYGRRAACDIPARELVLPQHLRHDA